MSDIKLLIEKKKINEDKLISVFLNYCGKYIRKLYSSLPDKKIFLKNLIDISYWNNNKKEKEYLKFLKWCEKAFDIEEEELKYLLYTTLYLSIEIMIYNYEYSDFLNNINFLSTQEFFYKCMKGVSRFYYENFNKLNASDKSKNELSEVISLQLHKAMPLKKIIKFIQESEENNPFIIKYKNSQKNKNMSESNDSYSNSDSNVNYSYVESKIKNINIEKISDKSSIKEKLKNNSSNSSHYNKKSDEKIKKSKHKSILKEISSENSTRRDSKSDDDFESENSTRRDSKSDDDSKSKNSTRRNSKSDDDSESENSTRHNSKSDSVENLQYIPVNKFEKTKHVSEFYNTSKKNKKVEKYEDVKHISLKPKKNY